tara:strand:- start:1884 stop:3092 length:1209 start_codon:yes stop_codon:yes gene_type:complete
MIEKTMGLIVALDDYSGFAKQNEVIFKELSLNFKNVYIVNLINLKFGKKKKFIKTTDNLPKNFICKDIENSSDFKKFFKDKNFIGIQYLDKTPEFFRIFYLLKKFNIKNIMIMNLGNFGNKQTIDWNFKYMFSAYKHYYTKGFYYLFRILTILNIFPKIDLLFESNTEIIHALNNGISRKFEKIFPYFKISYFRKIETVNSIFYDHFQNHKELPKINTQKQILYVDTPINHPDRILREGNLKKEYFVGFYRNLNIFLENLSKEFGMKIVICLHPSNKVDQNYFSNFEISEKKTIDMIPESEIIVFSISSAILNAVMYKKKIINIRSKYMGDYLNNFNKKYVNSLDLFSVNIDEKFEINKDDCIKKLSSTVKNFDTFIKKRLGPDGNKLSKEKIVEKIKENFF